MFKFFKSFLISVFLLFTFVGVARADNLMIQGIDMPSWVNWEPLYISYTALEIEGNPVLVKGYLKKDGEGWQEVGTSSELSDTFEVSRSYYPGDGVYKIYFKEINSGKTTPEESFNVDFTAPSGVSNYSKERKDANVYKICWKNPDNDDLDRVIIFRSEKTDGGFDKVAEVSGSKNEEKCHENGTPDSKDYYYVTRAVDHAGNASGEVGDSEVINGGTVLGESVSPTVTPEVVVLSQATGTGSDQEVKEGEIAGGGADEIQEEATGAFGEFGKAVGQQVARFNYWQITGIVIVIAGIIVLIIYLLKKEKK